MIDRDFETTTGGLQQHKHLDPVSPTDEQDKTETSTDQQDKSQEPTRWQRFKQHPAFKSRAFKTTVAVSIAVVGGGAILASRPNEDVEQVDTSVLNGVEKPSDGLFDGVVEGSSRKSPREHSVNGYQRSQRYGSGLAERKTIQIPPYSRGSA